MPKRTEALLVMPNRDAPIKTATVKIGFRDGLVLIKWCETVSREQHGALCSRLTSVTLQQTEPLKSSSLLAEPGAGAQMLSPASRRICQHLRSMESKETSLFLFGGDVNEKKCARSAKPSPVCSAKDDLSFKTGREVKGAQTTEGADLLLLLLLNFNFNLEL
ncbi:hypothetical protein EYF80_061304 [Liparis tanakae]|uniref:Uncharacterized protein n=1 Tax=Liparis tanakae TaxID=230148 RepID=A0A4Z2EIH0_9TELE|nr:hypothetical protein EYF80_061304 [Liparis tanakae]